jgi:zinc and cadmium transporter
MTTLAWIVLCTGLGGLLSVAAAGAFLLLPSPVRARVIPHMVSFATGALLGAALLALVPHAMQGAGPARLHEVGIALVAGIGLFFVLEKLVLWRHCHVDECEEHGADVHLPSADENRARASGSLVLVGDGLHNALDGVLIAAAFLTDTHLGIVTAVAIVAHEIPQEMGIFAVLLHSGMSRSRALVLNLLTSLSSVIGGIGAYFALERALDLLPFAIAVAAASLLYVAVADLIPGLHRRFDARASVTQVLLMTMGIAVIAFAERHAH